MSSHNKLLRAAHDLAEENQSYLYLLRRIAQGTETNPQAAARQLLGEVVQEPTGKGVARLGSWESTTAPVPAPPASINPLDEKPVTGVSGPFICPHGLALGLHCTACGGLVRRPLA